MKRAEFLQTIRDQLQLLVDFVSATPCTRPYQDTIYWLGDLPASTQLYIPENWQKRNKSVAIIWEQYLLDLRQAGENKYYEKAQDLPIADLLAASEGEE